MLTSFKAEVDDMNETSDGYSFYVNLRFVVPEKLKKKAIELQKEVGGKYSRFGFGVYVLLDENGFDICPLSYFDEYTDNELSWRFTVKEKEAILDACAKEMLHVLKGKE